ncbi:hypothetical protein MCOR26_010874, partial [Pyricularia oryzae]
MVLVLIMVTFRILHLLLPRNLGFPLRLPKCGIKFVLPFLVGLEALVVLLHLALLAL